MWGWIKRRYDLHQMIQCYLAFSFAPTNVHSIPLQVAAQHASLQSIKICSHLNAEGSDSYGIHEFSSLIEVEIKLPNSTNLIDNKLRKEAKKPFLKIFYLFCFFLNSRFFNIRKKIRNTLPLCWSIHEVFKSFSLPCSQRCQHPVSDCGFPKQETKNYN